MFEMTRARFAALAEAFGGEIARWPAADREAAAALLASDPDFAAATLAEASGLDEVLAQWPAMEVRPALRQAVIAAAPRPRPAFWSWTIRLGLGAGLAGACASGVAAGVLFLGDFNQAGGAALTAAMTGFEGEASNITDDV
jgi:hypothetical protein